MIGNSFERKLAILNGRAKKMEVSDCRDIFSTICYSFSSRYQRLNYIMYMVLYFRIPFKRNVRFFFFQLDCHAIHMKQFKFSDSVGSARFSIVEATILQLFDLGFTQGTL